MEQVYSQLTVYFEDPYWVGVYERYHKGKLEAAKITFGAEPKDYEVLQFLYQAGNRLRFSPALPGERKIAQIKNPKRRQREARKQLQATGSGTKAQQALQLEREQHKLERKTASRAQRETEQERRYALRQQKKKAKHKGR